MDSAVSGASPMGGSCTAGAALSKCHQELFFVQSSRGRSRVLVVLMAGKSTGDVSAAAASLRTSRVKITVVGMGELVDHAQLSHIAYPSSSVLRMPSINGYFDISGSLSALISQGNLLLGDFAFRDLSL